MLSHDLKDLQTSFSDWINGRTKFTVKDARAFELKLKHSACKAALLELGVDQTVFDVEADIDVDDPKVVRFPRPHGRRVPITVEGRGDGAAS